MSKKIPKKNIRFQTGGFDPVSFRRSQHYGTQGGIERLEPVEQWFWVRDGMFGDWEYNENAVSGRRRGVPIERSDFVMLESIPLDQMLAPLYVQRVLAYFEFKPNDPDRTSKVVQDAAALAGAGFAMDPAEVSEKTGYRVTAMSTAAAG